jgi:hypothetical protein
MLKYLKCIDNKLGNILKNSVVKYSLILLLLVFTLSIKKICLSILKLLNNEVVLLMLGLIIVYFVYVDIILALVLTLSVIVLIQEYNIRMSVIHLNTTNNSLEVTTTTTTTTELNNNNLELQDMKNKENNKMMKQDNNKSNLEKQLSQMKYETVIPNLEFKKQMRMVPSSTYGELSGMIMSEPTNLNYEEQIGNLPISSTVKTMYSSADDKYQDFTVYAKINMGQTSSNKISLEKFGNMDVDKELEKKQYDHSSSKTATELLRIKDAGYINEENLNMIQSNNASLVQGHVPCAVESICGSMSAQSF